MDDPSLWPKVGVQSPAGMMHAGSIGPAPAWTINHLSTFIIGSLSLSKYYVPGEMHKI